MATRCCFAARAYTTNALGSCGGGEPMVSAAWAQTAHTVLRWVQQLFQLALEQHELLVVEKKLEHAALSPLPETAQRVMHFGPPTVARDVVGHQPRLELDTTPA